MLKSLLRKSQVSTEDEFVGSVSAFCRREASTTPPPPPALLLPPLPPGFSPNSTPGELRRRQQQRLSPVPTYEDHVDADATEKDTLIVLPTGTPVATSKTNRARDGAGVRRVASVRC